MHIQIVDLQELFQKELPCPLLSSELVHIKPRRSYFFLSASFSFQVAICARMCIFSNWSSSYSGFMPLSLKVIHIINIYKALYEMQLIHHILTTALWVWNFCLSLTHGEKLKLSGCDLPKVTQLVSDKTGAGTQVFWLQTLRSFYYIGLPLWVLLLQRSALEDLSSPSKVEPESAGTSAQPGRLNLAKSVL